METPCSSKGFPSRGFDDNTPSTIKQVLLQPNAIRGDLRKIRIEKWC